MSIPIANNNNPRVVAVAKEALTAWFTKKGMKSPDLEQKVKRIMDNLFCTNRADENALNSLASME